jgi:hypothetical protein
MAVMFSHVVQPVARSSPPRSEVLPPRLRFPILTLEERSLTPALGYVFNKKWLEPYEFIVSILWKLRTATALPGYALARLMGPRVDPYEGVAPQLGAIELERLRSALDLPAKTLRAALLPALRYRPCSESFRYCRRCIACGYHSALYQIERVVVCPGAFVAP